MSYEKRVGERIEVGDLRVRWRHLHATPKKPRGRRRRGRNEDVDDADAHMRNVSASGAGIVAHTDDSITQGTAVEVHVAPEATFVGRVRRVIPTSDPGWCYYGVEIADESEGFREWIQKLLDQRRNSVITESHWRSSF
ncbi:MAG: PilZ domain-containing protein [Microthrixaceae bacterium]